MCIPVAVRHKQLDCVTLVMKLILMTSSELHPLILEGSIRNYSDVDLMSKSH